MDVTGPGAVHGAFPLRPAERADAKPQATRAAAPEPLRDQLDISSAGRLMENMTQSSEMRAARLAQIKADIEAGSYETPDKLEAALDRMFQEIALRDE